MGLVCLWKIQGQEAQQGWRKCQPRRAPSACGKGMNLIVLNFHFWPVVRFCCYQDLLDSEKQRSRMLWLDKLVTKSWRLMQGWPPRKSRICHFNFLQWCTLWLRCRRSNTTCFGVRLCCWQYKARASSHWWNRWCYWNGRERECRILASWQWPSHFRSLIRSFIN